MGVGTKAYFSASDSASIIITAAWNTPTPTPDAWIPATLDVKPESLNETSKGNPVLAFVTLPAGCEVADVVVSSIRLCLGSEPCGTTGVPAHIQGGAAGDQVEGKLKSQGENIWLRIVFDRQAVIAMLQEAGPVDSVAVTVSGLIDPPGQLFAGSDEVKLIGADGAPLPALRMSPAVTQTPVPVMPSVTATTTPVPTLTLTPIITRTPSATSLPTEIPAASTATPTPTAAAVPTATHTATAVPTPTFTVPPGRQPPLAPPAKHPRSPPPGLPCQPEASGQS